MEFKDMIAARASATVLQDGRGIFVIVKRNAFNPVKTMELVVVMGFVRVNLNGKGLPIAAVKLRLMVPA